jgi:hypothetical protein
MGMLLRRSKPEQHPPAVDLAAAADAVVIESFLSSLPAVYLYY